MKRLAWLALFLVLAACAKAPTPPKRLSFYYWKTVFRWDERDRSFMADAGAQRLYVRCYDLDLAPQSKGPAPLAPIRGLVDPGAGIEVLPVVYITGAALKSLKAADVPRLAGRLQSSVAALFVRAGLARPSELQVDADWTPSTREAYFALLRALKAAGPAERITVTLRLHQLKNLGLCGVPPADRAVLMAYHSRSPLAYRGGDSILDGKDAAPYLGGLGTYPLPVDLALPAFRWGVLFGPDKKAKRILPGLGAEALAANGSLHRRRLSWGWDVVQDGQVGGVALTRGDRLRLDAPLLKVGLAVAARAELQRGAPFDEWVYFDYDRDGLGRFAGNSPVRLKGGR